MSNLLFIFSLFIKKILKASEMHNMSFHTHTIKILHENEKFCFLKSPILYTWLVDIWLEFVKILFCKFVSKNIFSFFSISLWCITLKIHINEKLWFFNSIIILFIFNLCLNLVCSCQGINKLEN